MWQYEKKLQYPVNIKTPNPKLAKVIISQLGGLNTKKIYKKEPHPCKTSGACCIAERERNRPAIVLYCISDPDGMSCSDAL